MTLLRNPMPASLREAYKIKIAKCLQLGADSLDGSKNA
jgi:hypothetical protein